MNESQRAILELEDLRIPDNEDLRMDVTFVLLIGKENTTIDYVASVWLITNEYKADAVNLELSQEIINSKWDQFIINEFNKNQLKIIFK